MKEYFDHAYFTFLAVLNEFAGIGRGIAVSFIYITIPIWIIPYAICKKLKQAKE